jgi:hypothetical protein
MGKHFTAVARPRIAHNARYRMARLDESPARRSERMQLLQRGLLCVTIWTDRTESPRSPVQIRGAGLSQLDR